MNRLGEIATDATGIAGAALITYGAHLVYAPLGYIIGGGFLLGFAWLLARRSAD